MRHGGFWASGRRHSAQAWHHAEAWRIKGMLQGGQVVGIERGVVGEVGSQQVTDPASQLRPIRSYGLRRQAGMIEAAEPETDHEDHRQVELNGQPREILAVVERDTPAPGTLYQDEVMRLFQQRSDMFAKLVEADAHPHLASRYVRGGGRLKGKGVDRLVGWCRYAARHQDEGIVVAQAGAGTSASRGDGLEPQGAQAARAS